MPTQSSTHKGKLIDSGKGLCELAEVLSRESIIGFDTEFIRESSFFPQLEILQIATAKEVFLVDVRAFLPDQKMTHEEFRTYMRSEFEPLEKIFSNSKILKIVHAAPGDQECLLTTFGFVANPALDTAIAASLLGMGEGLGLAALLLNVLNVKVKKGHARTNWAKRPLPPELIDYAASDVEFLVELGEVLIKELEKTNRKDWAIRLTAQISDPLLLEPSPEQIAKRLFQSGRIDRASAGVLLKLVEWRERRTRELNIPRRWLADDGVLVDLTRTMPKREDQLLSYRGLQQAEVKKNGRTILALIEEGRSLEPSFVNEGKSRVRSTSKEEDRALDLLKCFINLKANEHRVSSRTLIDSDTMILALRSSAQTLEEFQKEGLLDPEALQLIGGDLFKFLNGKEALTLKDRKLELFQIEPGSRKN